MAYHFEGFAGNEAVLDLHGDESTDAMDGIQQGLGGSAFIARCVNAAKSYEAEHGVRVSGKVKDGNRILHEI